MKLQVLIILLSFSILYNARGQNDTAKSVVTNNSHTWQNNIGIGISFLFARQASNSYSSDDIRNFKTTYRGIAPEISCLLLTQKKKFILRNQLSLTLMLTRIEYEQLSFTNWLYPGYSWFPNIGKFKYGILNYKISAGIQLRRFIILPGAQLGWIIFGHFSHERLHSSWGPVYTYINNGLVFGPNLELGIKLSKKWQISASCFFALNEITIRNYYYPQKYYLSSIQISLIKIFFNKSKAK